MQVVVEVGLNRQVQWLSVQIESMLFNQEVAPGIYRGTPTKHEESLLPTKPIFGSQIGDDSYFKVSDLPAVFRGG